MDEREREKQQEQAKKAEEQLIQQRHRLETAAWRIGGPAVDGGVTVAAGSLWGWIRWKEVSCALKGAGTAVPLGTNLSDSYLMPSRKRSVPQDFP